MPEFRDTNLAAAAFASPTLTTRATWPKQCGWPVEQDASSRSVLEAGERVEERNGQDHGGGGEEEELPDVDVYPPPQRLRRDEAPPFFPFSPFVCEV